MQAARALGPAHDVRLWQDQSCELFEKQGSLLAAVGGCAAALPDEREVSWIRRLVPDEHSSNQPRWPTDPGWREVQLATFARSPAEARRLIRRRQWGMTQTS